MDTLNIRAIEQKLVEDRNYWQGVVEHMIEPASMDCNSNVQFDVAKNKTATIDRALKRIRSGTFGQCEKCRCQIDPERLETLIESDCHLCAQCARTIRAQVAKPTKKQHLCPIYGPAALAGQFA